MLVNLQNDQNFRFAQLPTELPRPSLLPRVQSSESPDAARFSVEVEESDSAGESVTARALASAFGFEEPDRARRDGTSVRSVRSSQRSSRARRTRTDDDRNTALSRLSALADRFGSKIGKAISDFSKALPALAGTRKGHILRTIISTLRGFDSLVDALKSGNIRSIASTANHLRSALGGVGRIAGNQGIGALARRGAAFIPALGTGLSAHSAYQAVRRAEQASANGNQTAAAIWSGAAGLHTLAAVLSGAADLLLPLSGGTTVPAFAALNGVVSGLGAVGDIAGAIAE